MKRGAAFKGDSRAQLNTKRPRGTLAAASVSTLLWCGCSLNPIGEDPGFGEDSQTNAGTPTMTDPAQGSPIPAGTVPPPANAPDPSPTTLPTAPAPTPGPADPSDDDEVIIGEPEPRPILEPESGPSAPGPIDANAGDGGYPFDGGAPTDAGDDLAPAR